MWKDKSKAEVLIEELKLKKDKVDLEQLKFYCLKQDKEFWEEFEELLRDWRKNTAKGYRFPLTLKILKQWKKMVNLTTYENSNQKSGQNNHFNSQNHPTSLPTEPTHGPFIYDLRTNQLWYQNQLFRWESRSQVGGDWFGSKEIKIYIQRLDNWNISVHAKIGLSLTYKAYFSCFKTEKITLFFQPWNQVQKNEEGKWEPKLTSQDVQ